MVRAGGAGCGRAELGVVYAMEIDQTIGGVGESLEILRWKSDVPRDIPHSQILRRTNPRMFSIRQESYRLSGVTTLTHHWGCYLCMLRVGILCVY